MRIRNSTRCCESPARKELSIKVTDCQSIGKAFKLRDESENLPLRLSYACGTTGTNEMNRLTKTLISILCALFCLTSRAEAPADTTGLREVQVLGVRQRSEVIPVQSLGGKELQRLNSHSVADAMRYFSGVQVKDYGGVGGIKTVNIRSMGTNHTGVVYDGIELGNAQNGQIDLGQFSLDNIEEITLHNGQKSELLQPAKDFGAAGTVYMRTRRPHFRDGEKWHLRAGLKTGSFDLLNLSATAEMRLIPRVNASLSADWLTSSGKYKFRYRRLTPTGAVAYDTTATRRNGDIGAVRVEANVYGTLQRGSWTAKAYHYSSERGIPGAIVNNVWRRGERQWDNNSFAQGSWQSSWGQFTTLFNAKYSFYNTHYVNNDSRQIRIDNRYRQHEFYFSSANQLQLTSKWNLALSYDFQWNHLWADLADFVMPRRISNFLSLATSLDLNRLKLQASGMATFVHDNLDGRQNPADKHVFTPAVYASFFPLRTDRSLSLRAFVKQSYRMPTFNDLYYTDVGNARLDPERVTQYNVGLLFERRRAEGLLRAVRLSADAYYNYVTDKIVAYPKGQQFRWTMLNLGKVDIRGVDVSALLTLNPVDDLLLTLRGQYTFQRAIDITSPSDSYYRHQIPYIPRHSASAVFNASWRAWALNYSYIYIGERYSQQENIAYNYMRPWSTSDLSLSRDFTLGRVSLRALLEVNNLLARSYDVILNYPMPLRNYRLTLTVSL